MDSKKRLFIFIGGLVLAAVIFLFSLIKTGHINLAGGSASKCGGRINYQGYTYKTVQIGGQCWMKENLKTTKYRDGTPISNLTADAGWVANKKGAYVCYQNVEKNCSTYGALYNWYAVSNSAGLCPTGWSVPTHNQWTDLERSVCNSLGRDNCEAKFAYDGPMGWVGTDEGNNLKSKSSKGSDAFGFTALFGGFRNPGGSFSSLGEKGFWWTSTLSEEFAYGRILDTNNQGVRQMESIKSSGFSVRCIKD